MDEDIGIKKGTLALLIDGDNASPKLLGKILSEVSKYGTLTIRRIYGDWTQPQMNGWKEELNNHSVQPIQQFRYTVGKNATDSALIIEAMDILHDKHVDGFCIVASDSDYTRLAMRIREQGLFVLGVGEEKTPMPFINACNIFIYTENLVKKIPEDDSKKIEKKLSGDKKEQLGSILNILKEAYEMSAPEGGWLNIATLGNNLLKLSPGFDPRTYGFNKLSWLIKAYPKIFEVRMSEEGAPGTVMHVRMINPET